MFLVNNRLNIFFVLNTLSQYTIKPSHENWNDSKNVLIYMQGTINFGLRYTIKNTIIHEYIYVDWVDNSIDRKNTFRCFFSLGYAMISWMSRKKKSVALSTTEVEYIAASMASYEVVWLRKLFGELFEQVPDTTVIYCDNNNDIFFE